jgi:glycosyltransferase 2 family protein
MSRKTLIAGVKIVILAAILAIIGWNLHSAWREVGITQLKAAIEIDWRWSLIAGVCFAGELFTSAAAWLWLLRRMEGAGSPLFMFGAYFFSQLGKYVPGKIMLLIMRLERTNRQGVSGAATTISTLMENATFMVSGAAVAVPILAQFLLARNPAGHRWLLLLALSSMIVLLTAIHPAIFYRILNPVLLRLGRSEIAAQHRLPMNTLLASVAMMIPCWFFGGLALWATIRCLMPIGMERFWELTAAFALSVLAGMISFLPIGLGVRDVVQALFLLPIIAAGLPGAGSFAEAELVVTLVILLQRVFQISMEAVLGLLGGWITTGRMTNDE